MPSRSSRYNNTKTKVNKKKEVKQKVVKPKKKKRIRYKFLFLVLLIIAGICIIFSGIISLPITNIYISGNKYLSDQQVIEIAHLENYPSTFENLTLSVDRRLEKNELILNAKVTKKWFRKVYIEVEENIPLFYNSSSSKTVLLDGKESDNTYRCATLINYVPDTIYNNFVDKMKGISSEVLLRISEIKYDPNDVDSDRFLLLMTDGNYVYLTLNKFDSINNYIDIIKKFTSKKGILYLDSGEYFKTLDN